MGKANQRRSFLKKVALGGAAAMVSPATMLAEEEQQAPAGSSPVQHTVKRSYNAPYKDAYLNRVAFPVGGLGAGMFCLEGTGALSHMSIRNRPEIFHEPAMFAALHVKGIEKGTKLLEGPVPEWKFFGQRGTGNGATGATYGLPRFNKAVFDTKFPFAHIQLTDSDLPLSVKLTGWSPFIPTEEDNSSMPIGALEYTFTNTGAKMLEAIFSYSSKNFLESDEKAVNKITATDKGFVLQQGGTADKPFLQSAMAVFSDHTETAVDHCWFRGGWWDPLTMAWNNIRDGIITATAPVDKSAPGATLYMPFHLHPGASTTIRVYFAWYTPESNIHIGEPMPDEKKDCDPVTGCCVSPKQLGIVPQHESDAVNFKPWYSSQFNSIDQVIEFWKSNYNELKRKTELFTNAFYASTLPAEVMEAVAANLTIIKSPTVLRQYDGRLWSWEGCGDDGGCCHGSCTHVWNYAQAIPHLFPALERSLRHTEFCESQNREGHQTFRANAPISPAKHDFHAAADGQLGGIMKVYRDWRICGDDAWLAKMYPMVQRSIDYCIKTWDPRSKGVVEEPHHNTYDIEFWGPDGMMTSFYAGALKAISEMGKQLNKDVSKYTELYEKSRHYLETKLYDGEYFIQDIEYKGLNAPDPAKAQSYGGEYSEEAIAMLHKEGPKYQYGAGCLSDGVLGAWIANVCGLSDVIDPVKIKSHLKSVHKYNLKKDLSDHANPQRPSFAVGHEGGLLLCTWPKGGKLSLPFVYSDEVWTGIEYQVASHLMLMGHAKEGLDIVRYCRDRYDGRVRNPFNEYECGHWYARAMSSYGLLQGLTGIRYDAVTKTLYVNSQIGDFTCFISTATGFGTVQYKAGKASVQTAFGQIDVKHIVINEKKSI